jgi:hypothetical protein
LSLAISFLSFSLKAQVKGKDTVQVDSTHQEKIRKMPMDTIHHKTPVKPVLPEQQRDRKNEEPILTPSGKKD